MLILEPWGRLEELADDLTANLEQFGVDEHAALIAFPDLRQEGDVLQLLERLAGVSDRWRYEIRDGDPAPVSVYWRTEHDDESDALGLCPFLTMPETRRTPYVCLALWPGARNKSPVGRPVSFMDMPSRLQEDQHSDLIATTRTTVSEILGDDRAKPDEYFTFLLPRRIVE